jgi:Na+/proline symporter
MSPIDWVVLAGTLLAFVAYGTWRGRRTRDLDGYLVAGRAMPWPMVLVSVMATQASAITFLSGPGQGYADGLRFVQFYFGLPVAMVVLAAIAVPAYQRLKVFTAYQYLERRFDGKTRTLAAALFLVQRGLAVGLTLYAPALVLSVILGWDIRLVCAVLGALVVVYTATGGSRAVSHAHALQFTIIMVTMVVAFGLVLARMPAGVGAFDAAWLAGRLGRFEALDLGFDPDDRYNLWSGLIGGFFLQMSYFGTDQSQVGRLLTGSSTTQSRLGMLANGMLKIPMQLFILTLGAMIFAFHLFAAPPLHFNPVEARLAAEGATAARWTALDAEHRMAFEARRDAAERILAARRAGDPAAEARASAEMREAQARLRGAHQRGQALVREAVPGSNANDTNYVFLSFVRAWLPVGLIGMVFAAVIAASMNSISAELNALTSTSIVDVWRRLPRHVPDERRDLVASRVATVAWTAFAVGFAQWASGLGTLIEAVNILGSLFYGTILGIFLTAFLMPWVGGTAVFVAALVAEAAVLACFRLTPISFLWYNVIGCLLVMGIAMAVQPFVGRGRRSAA